MSKPSQITVSQSRRGMTIKATGGAAHVLFDALTGKDRMMACQRPYNHTVEQCIGQLRELAFKQGRESINARMFETCAQHLLRLMTLEAEQAQHPAPVAAMAAQAPLGAQGCITLADC